MKLLKFIFFVIIFVKKVIHTMKNKFLFLIIVLFCLFLVACKEEKPDDVPTDNPPVVDPTDNPTIDPHEGEQEDSFDVLERELTLNYNEEKSLTITKSRDNLELIFKSNNESVATVTNGKVKAVGQGNAIITIEISGGDSVAIKVTVNEAKLILTGVTSMVASESQTLKLDKNYSMQETIDWTSSDTNVATVDDKGKVDALSAGTAIITATAKTSGAKTQITITVTQPDVAPKEIKITSNVSSEVYLDTEIILSCEVLPKGANQEVEWTCTNQARATIDPDGYVNILKAGKITIKCTSKVDPDIKASFSFDVLDYIDPEKFFNSIHVANPLNNQVRAYGFGPIKESAGLTQIDYIEVIAGAVTLLGWDFDWVLNENFIVPASNTNPRPGTLREVRYICVHDTATTHSHTTAYNLANNLKSTSNTTSWHYSCGAGVAFHSIPDNEVAHHAGDGTSIAQEFIDTGVKAVGTQPAWVTISDDGFFEFTPFYRGKYDESLKVKSSIEAPEVPIQYYSGGWQTSGYRKARTSDLPNYTSVTNYIGENGNYWMTNIWWSTSYQTLSNRGGNLNSIGIESCVNYGCDLYRVWMTLAKLIGTRLLPNNKLTPAQVKQHNTFSGKNCPETLRENDLWPYFMKMVEAEYTFYTKMRDFVVTFDKGDTDLINESGQIVKWPDVDTEVTYTIHVVKRDGTYDKTFTYTSIIPAKVQNPRKVGQEDPYYYMTLEAREKQIEHRND